MTSEKQLFLAHLDEEIEQNPQRARAVLDELFAIVKEKATTQDLCEIRRQVTRYIDEIETYNSNAGEHSTFHQFYKDMMTAFLAYVTYLRIPRCVTK